MNQQVQYQYGAKALAPPVFDVRALPRKRKPVEDEQPLFLRKVFSMISNCPPAIGGWAAHGETFIIKNADKFAEEIIPTAFKHSKFSSFVRQLNFYGFRKVRPDAVSLAHWWEFRHPYFKRDEPELISKIKKSVHFDANGQPVIVKPESGAAGAGAGGLSAEEVYLLQSEMESMKSRMSAMENHISDLTSLVHTLMNGQKGPIDFSSGASAAVTEGRSLKKRKTTSTASVSSSTFSLQMPAELQQQDMEGDGWDDDMESKLFADSSFDLLPMSEMMMTPHSFDDLSISSTTASATPALMPMASALAGAAISKQNSFATVFDNEKATLNLVPVVSAEAYPLVTADYSTHPLADPATMVGMVDLMARTLGTVASMCQQQQQQQQQQAQFHNGMCQCPNCKPIASSAGAATDDTTTVLPVMGPLVAATMGAFTAKFGEQLFSQQQRVTPAATTQESH